jgi:type I restriction enzyme, S subunit
MSDTDYSELGSLADIQTGPFGSQLHSSDYVDEGTPIITVEHLIGENGISHDSIPLVSVRDRTRLIRYSLHTGDLVFSRVGAIDRCSYVSPSEDGWLFSGRLLRVRPDRSRVDSRFLASYLSHEPSQRWIRNYAVGSTMPCLNTSILEQVPLSLPSLQAQRTIAEILDTTDNAIESTERLIAKLEQAKQGLLHDLLTRGIGEAGQLRDPLDPKQFKDSTLGRIPLTWSVQRIGQIGKTVTGSTPPSSIKDVWGEGLNFVTPGDIMGDSVAMTKRQVSPRGERFTRHVPAGSVLVVCIGSTVGKSAVTSRPCATNQQINAIMMDRRFDSDFIHASFIQQKRRFLSLAGLQALPIVNKSQFDSIEIAVAPAEEQHAIGSRLRAASSVLQDERRFIDGLRVTKHGLMDDLLTGRVRVGASG